MDIRSRAIHTAISRANRRRTAQEQRRQRRIRLSAMWANRYAYSEVTRTELRTRICLEYLTAGDLCQLFRSEVIKNGFSTKEAHAKYPWPE